MRKKLRGMNLVPGFDSLDQRIALSTAAAAMPPADQPPADTSTTDDGGDGGGDTGIRIPQPPGGGSSPTKPCATPRRQAESGKIGTLQ